MSQLKVPLIFFSIAFVLSAVLALFSGSSWLGVIFKASVSSLVIAGFVLLARMLLAKYIPDIFEGSDSQDSPETPIVGTNLDIRIGEDSSQGDASQEYDVDLGSPTFISGDESTTSQDNANLKEEENAEESPFEGDALLTSPDSLVSSKKSSEGASESGFTPTSFVKDAHPDGELSVSDKKDANQNNQRSEQDISPDSNEGNAEPNKPEKSTPNVDGLASADSDEKILDEELKESIEKDVDRLEELPDLQEFVDSSNLPGNDSKAEELMNSGTQSFFASDVGESVTDSKLMANAIRTVLKREA